MTNQRDSWQMTRQEFLDKVSGLGKRPSDSSLLNQHRWAVEMALETGQTVPPEVLAEYIIEHISSHNVRLTPVLKTTPT